MADKRDQEREGFGQALREMASSLRKDVGNEVMYAQADIRHKFEEAAYGHRVTPPFREGHDKEEASKGPDIHGNGGEQDKGRSYSGFLEQTYGPAPAGRDQAQDRSRQQEQSIER